MKYLQILSCTFLLLLLSCENGSHHSYLENNLENLTTGPEEPSPGDQYAKTEESPFINVADAPLSTFSIDADGASYANLRRYIWQDERLPPKDAVRTEELINYFELDYPFEEEEHSIAVHGEVSTCPWNEENRLLRIGIMGKDIPDAELPPANFVFLIDVSGSMNSRDKLGVLKRGFTVMVEQMRPSDRVAIVTYAGSAAVALASTPGDQKTRIKAAIKRLGAGGGTAGAAGIITAYEIAKSHFVEGGNNRVIIGTDGDFNVGVSNRAQLVELVEEKRDEGIFLTVLGVGRGNLNDAVLEQLANKGNGSYEYIDNLRQLKRVFVEERNKFYTIAQDVKLQLAFDPQRVRAYRLIGYENRELADHDFNDDRKDAGEIGIRQSITALYELIPNEQFIDRTLPIATIDVRYKEPMSYTSVPIATQIMDTGQDFVRSSDFMRFTASVAAFSMLVRDSKYKGTSSYREIYAWLKDVELADRQGFKKEFRQLVKRAHRL